MHSQVGAEIFEDKIKSRVILSKYLKVSLSILIYELVLYVEMFLY